MIHKQLCSAHCLCRFGWLDVVVHAKEVCRVVFVLQGSQSVVVRTVGSPREDLSFVGDVVDIGAGHKVRPHRFPIFPRPLDVFVRVGRVFPVRPDYEIVRVVAVRESGIAYSYSRDCSVPMLEDRSKCITRGTLTSELRNYFDGFIVQRVHKVGFDIGSTAWREERLEHALDLDVAHDLYSVGKWRTKFTEWSQ